MTKFTKIAATGLAALTISVGALSVSTEAQAGPKKWGPVAVGVGLGLIATGIIAEAAYQSQCMQPVFDRWGNYMGKRNICY